MSKPELPAIRFHEDPTLFEESLRFTSAESGFTARLVEKDYFCTLLLAYFGAAAGDDLVFKGGTCLTKVHAELYRLSEDLDFAISMPVEASRSDRGRRVDGAKRALDALSTRLAMFRVLVPLKGANNSTQYVATIGYTSVLDRRDEAIKIEVSLREPLLMPSVEGSARTLLLDPVTGKPLVAQVSVRCVSKAEALAEKFRAALSRREVAIRDFYDIDYAVEKGGLRPEAIDLVKQVKQKLGVPGNDPVDVSGERLAALRRQIEAQLRPILRDQDFAQFNLDRAFRTCVEMAKALRGVRG